VLGAQPPAQPHSGKGRLAVAEKKTNKGRDLINFFGFDSGNSPVQLLPDGTVAGLVVQCPFRTGMTASRPRSRLQRASTYRPMSIPAPNHHNGQHEFHPFAGTAQPERSIGGERKRSPGFCELVTGAFIRDNLTAPPQGRARRGADGRL
jgi:hypothetical protein